MNVKLFLPRLNVRGNFEYIIVDGKYVRLLHGERGVLLVAIGVSRDGRRAVLDIMLAREEDRRSYWEFLVGLWRRYHVKLIVAYGVRALDSAISSSGIRVVRQMCIEA